MIPGTRPEPSPPAVAQMTNRRLRARELRVRADWAAGSPTLALHTLEIDEPAGAGRRRRMLIDSAPLDAAHQASGGDPGQLLQGLAAQRGLALLDSTRPLRLRPVRVPKPWGEEIWYSGVEQRGVSLLEDEQGRLPLAWALSAAGDLLGAGVSELPLVKLLRPLAEPVLGELYFERHDHKHETYLVTAVDPCAWPGGVGAVRLGLDPQRLRDEGAARTRAAFLQAARAYERARAAAEAAGAAEESPDADLLAADRGARDAVTALTHRRAVAVGDVVDVPPGVPHALMHGVEVLECQTPHFERRVLFFGRPLQTQRGWDLDTGIRGMILEPPPAPRPELLTDGPDGRLERLTGNPHYEMLRARPAPDRRLSIPTPAATVLIALHGRLDLAGLGVLDAGQAALLPAGCPATLAGLAEPGTPAPMAVLCRPSTA